MKSPHYESVLVGEDRGKDIMPGNEDRAVCPEGQGWLLRVPKNPVWGPLNDQVPTEVSNQGGCFNILGRRAVVPLQAVTWT